MFYAPRKSGTTGVVVTTPKDGEAYRRTAVVILDGSVACPPFVDISGEDLRKIVDFVQVYRDTFHKDSDVKSDTQEVSHAKARNRELLGAKCAARRKEIW